MPELVWQGKAQVKHHHLDVPFHFLTQQYEYLADEAVSQNRLDNILIYGDNLLALKSLLPKFGGKIDCIYIDPPYNTGNEGWVYNDNVNDPRILKWLGEVVGKEGEDFSRHDKWLCMMYPRLRLLKQLLADDGILIVHIDENSSTLLHSLLIEIFGRNNDLGTIIWDKKNPKGDAKKISYQHESIMIFSNSGFHEKHRLKRTKKNAPKMLKKAMTLFKKIGKQQYPEDLKKIIKKYNLPETHLKDHKFIADLQWINNEYQEWLKTQSSFSNGEKAYKFIDENGDVYRLVSMAWPNKETPPEEYFTPLIHPITQKACPVPERGWRYPLKSMQELLQHDLIIFGPDETTIPNRKYFLKENLTENIPSILGFGGSDDSLQKQIGINLENPKPFEFATELLDYFTDKNAIVLDSFIGSGTTAHAVLQLNKQDGGNRQFIGIEMMDYAETTTAKRIKKVMAGYGTGKKTVTGTGGGFSFYTVGNELFDKSNNLNHEAPITAIREYIAYTESLNTIWSIENEVSPYMLGYQNGAAYVFYYNEDVTTLSWEFLDTLNAEGFPEKPEQWIIYADANVLTEQQLKQNNIVFKRIPRDISKL